ncbi:MAG: M20/M25/M40 family metallo-hydrolase [Chitinophagaceae bacterium]|nr:M20/M25/M40 family metallo-hydrolase [Chitinophagaceae bacterium]
MKKIFTVLCTLYVYSLSAQTQDSLFIRHIADEVLLNGRAYENLRYLTKQIGHRLAGSPQMVNAERWGLEEMQKAGADKAWLQECMVPHWVRGGRDIFRAERLVSSDGKINRWSTRFLDVLALGNSLGSKTSIRAQVLEIKDFNDLEAKRDSIRGKIVFYNYKFNPTYIRTFESYRDAVIYRGQGPSRAAKYGAKAVVIRSMTHSTDNNPHTGSTNYVDSLPKIPALAVGLRDADWLDSTLQKTVVFATVQTNGHFLPDTISHNVIGELRGTEFPNEYLTVGGHLDSWDVGEGAHDDGAGVVQTIEVLRVLKALEYKPKHTLRFVLFANEENGLRGGTKYADEAKAKNEKHIFALESDAGGFTPRGFGFTLPDAQFENILRWKGLLSPYGATEIVKGGGGADIGPLNRTQGTAVGSLNPDSQRYFDVHHARSDIFEAVNKRELELGAVCMAALVYLIDKYSLER